MKKLRLCFMAICAAIISLLCFAFLGCEQDKADAKHTHTPGEVISVTSPTCTERGFTVYKCGKCSGRFADDYVPATGHTLEDRPAQSATCLEDGWYAYKECAVCGFNTKEVQYALGHDPVKFGNAVPATCQNGGVDHGYKCSVCDTVLQEPMPSAIKPHDYQKGICIYCEREEVYTARFTAFGQKVEDILFTVSTAKDVVAPAVPQADGYENCHWQEYELSYGDVEVELEYDLIEYTVEFESDDSVYRVDTYTVETGLDFPGMGKNGYRFLGWFDDDQYLHHIDKGSTGDKRLVAHWELAEYSITYRDTKTGSTEGFPSSYTMETETIVLPELDAPGYTFNGWLRYSQKFTSIVKGSYGDIILVADLTPMTYKMTLDADGGKISATSHNVVFDSFYNLPVPVKDRHEFLGWFDGPQEDAKQLTSWNGQGNSVYAVPNDITVYAHWQVITYLIRFNTDGGTEIPSVEFETGEYFVAPPNPVKEGWYFAGWYDVNGERYTHNTVIKRNSVLYAKWIDSIGVSDAAGFIAIADAPEKNYHLLCDIDLRGIDWTPIKTFTGTIDGNGYKVKNFGVSHTVTTDTEYGFVCNNQGTIKNLDLVDVTYNVQVNYRAYHGKFCGGFIAAKNSGIIENVRLLSGTFSYNYYIEVGYADNQNFYLNAGGMVGYNAASGTISGCTYELPISIGVVHYNHQENLGSWYFRLYSYVGGIVGYNEGLVENCTFKQDISATSRTIASSGDCETSLYIGGVVGGVASSGSVKECAASGTYSLAPSSYRNSMYGGAFAGSNGGDISDCYAGGTVSGGGKIANSMGGFVGINLENGTVQSCYTSAIVNNDSGGNVGGFVGENRSTVQNCYCTGSVASSASATAGGFVGSNTASGTVKKCYSVGDISIKSGTCGRFAGKALGSLYKVYYVQGMTANVGGQYVTAFSDAQNAEVKGVSLVSLWSDEFLKDTLYWNEEGWALLTDEHPMLLFELRKEHDFDTTVTPPDCEHGGYTVYSCKDCDKIFVMDFVPAHGHDYVAVQTVPPTCLTDGYTLKKCSVCDAERRTDIVSATGHPSGSVTLKTDHGATCTAGGYRVYHCDECNNDFTVQEEAKGHDGVLKSTTVVPTCTQQGEATYICTVCNQEYTATLECVEHSWTDVAYQAPTCGVVIDEDGHKTVNPVDGHTAGVKCSVCGEVDYGCQILPAHSLVSVSVTTAPTCSAAGSGTFKCTICETELEMPIAALAHADQNADYICDMCDTLLFTDSELSSFVHISDVAGLASISQNPSSNYWLDADINLTNVTWTSIGTQQRPFKGIFYGNGHTVSGLSQSFNGNAQTNIGGLFGYNSGLILDVNVSGFAVSAVNADITFGGIAAYNNGRIVGCKLLGANTVSMTAELTVTDYNEHVVELTGSFVGGVVGVNGKTAEVENCVVIGTIQSEYYNSCTVNSAKATQFLQSLIHSTVAKTEQHITFGGIAGRNEGSISSCQVTGSISADVSVNARLSWMKGKAYAYSYVYAGALAGYNSGTVDGCAVKAMTYLCTAQTPEANFPQIFEGKLYALGTAYYNYAQTDGIDGVVGAYDTADNIDVTVL